MSFSELSLAAVIALILDTLLGEPKRFHPLVGFGNLATALETQLNKHQMSTSTQRLLGTLAWVFAVLPICAFIYFIFYSIEWSSPIKIAACSLVSYICIARKALIEHSQFVESQLHNSVESARHAISRIVSRNTEQLNAQDISKAAIESTLENCNDSVIAPLCCLIGLGPVGIVLYRLSNTLDAMWGYRNPRYENFGKFSARVDDVLNYLPAKICALLFCIHKNYRLSIKAWREQAKHCGSPNGGPVMCTGAAALKLRLGGPTIYHGVLRNKAIMGYGEPAQCEDISRANHFVNQRLLIFTSLIACLGILLGAK